MSYDPEELARGILELFAERTDSDQIVSAFAPSSRETKAPIDGFNFYKSKAQERRFYDWRDTEDLEQLERIAAERSKRAKYQAKDPVRWRAYHREWRRNAYAKITPEQLEAKRAYDREWRRKKRGEPKAKAEQESRLESWKAKGAAMRAKEEALAEQKRKAAAGDAEAMRAEKKRLHRAAQAQRRRARMTAQQKARESQAAGQRRKRSAA